MSVPSEKHDQNGQQPLAEEREYHSTMNWSTVAPGLAWVLLFWLIGPVLFPTLLIRKWAAAPIWDAKERWASVKGSAFLSLLCYLPAILFHQQLTSLWSHVPALGEASIFPPTFGNMLFRWVMALPLVHVLVWFVEVISPKTVWLPRRVLLPGEQVLVASTQPKGSNKTRRKSTQQHTARNGSALNANEKTSEQTSSVPTRSSQKGRVNAKPPGIPTRETKPRKKRDSRTLWQQLPDDHPWKQEAKREAMRQAGSQEAIPLQVTQKPSYQQTNYNWDEGEGTLKIYMLPGKLCGDVIQSEGEKWKIEERKKR